MATEKTKTTTTTIKAKDLNKEANLGKRKLVVYKDFTFLKNEIQKIKKISISISKWQILKM